jgi:hypothetical protein
MDISKRSAKVGVKRDSAHFSTTIGALRSNDAVFQRVDAFETLLLDHLL